MADNFTFDLSGLDDAIAKVQGMVDQLAPAMASGMFVEQNNVMNQSLEIVPVKDGHLKASGTVLPPTVTNNLTVECVSGYGGAAASYAWKQHERLDFQHKEGQQAKYLEQPAREALLGMDARLVEHIRSKVL